jgi:hypothetical protein
MVSCKCLFSKNQYVAKHKLNHTADNMQFLKYIIKNVNSETLDDTVDGENQERTYLDYKMHRSKLADKCRRRSRHCLDTFRHFDKDYWGTHWYLHNIKTIHWQKNGGQNSLQY